MRHWCRQRRPRRTGNRHPATSRSAAQRCSDKPCTSYCTACNGRRLCHGRSSSASRPASTMLPILLTTAFATRAPSLLYVDAVGPEPREFIQNLEERGVDVYRVFSRPFIAGVEQKGAPDEELDALMSLRAPSADDDVPTWASLLLDGDDADVLGVMCASDAGLATAERLQHALVGGARTAWSRRGATSTSCTRRCARPATRRRRRRPRATPPTWRRLSRRGRGRSS